MLPRHTYKNTRQLAIKSIYRRKTLAKVKFSIKLVTCKDSPSDSCTFKIILKKTKDLS